MRCKSQDPSCLLRIQAGGRLSQGKEYMSFGVHGDPVGYGRVGRFFPAIKLQKKDKFYDY
jgi:hypothetical protein